MRRERTLLLLVLAALLTCCSQPERPRRPREERFAPASVPISAPRGCEQAPSATTVTSFHEALRCLFEGTDPVQKGVLPGTISPERMAVVRGRVFDRAGMPIEGVRVTVLRGEQYGSTQTRAGGEYDLAVNGGGIVTLRFEHGAHLTVQRHEQTSWRRFTVMPDVVLLPPGKLAEPVALAELGAATFREGEPSEDADGKRQHVLLFKPGVRVEAELASGQRVPLASATVQLTEYTVGAAGPLAMPGDLPSTTAYTYAIDLSVIEANALGAVRVHFDPPLPTYLDNFLRFPAGTAVPNGFYDPARDTWEATDNGLVVKLVGREQGKARLDIDGDDEADPAASLLALGIDDVELAALATRYESGTSLWRVPLTHFTPYDHNWPFAPPADAKVPQATVSAPSADHEGPTRCGSIVGCEEQSFGELFPLTGTPMRCTTKASACRADSTVARCRST